MVGFQRPFPGVEVERHTALSHVRVRKKLLLAPGADELASMHREPAMEYKMDPNRQPRFIIRSCFGGSNAAFVASGSEVLAARFCTSAGSENPFLQRTSWSAVQGHVGMSR